MPCRCYEKSIIDKQPLPPQELPQLLTKPLDEVDLNASQFNHLVLALIVVLNHTIILNLRILDILPYSLADRWVLDCSDVLHSDGLALVEVLVVRADQHLLLAAYENLLVVGLETVLRVFREEVALLQLDQDSLPLVDFLWEVLLGLGEHFLRESWVKLQVLEVDLGSVEFAGVCPRFVVALSHVAEY